MTQPIRVAIGYDASEAVAWHVLCASIIRRTTQPIQFQPVGNRVLPTGLWWRGRGPYDATEFSNARFLTPYLMGYAGWAIFMDCDMLCLADIVDLWDQRDDRYAVMVVKHDYQPRRKTKFLGQEQHRYHRKNWSSLMLLNCNHPATLGLTPYYVNRADGLDLHGFAWCPDEQIGEITGPWNVLATGDCDTQHPTSTAAPALLHYTEGGPWHGVRHSLSHLWEAERDEMLTSTKGDAQP